MRIRSARKLICRTLARSLWLAGLLSLASLTSIGGELKPYGETLPVDTGREAADNHLKKAREANRALIADLADGASGTVAESAAKTLSPGRYRLRALVRSTPGDSIVVEAVDVILGAGKHSKRFLRERAFPEDAKWREIWMDFPVTEAGAVPLSLRWEVGDSHIDKKRFRNINQARHVYKETRQAAIDEYRLKQKRGSLLGGAGSAPEKEEDGLDAELLEAGASTWRELGAEDLPPFRLEVAALRVEKISPVVIAEIRTSTPACELGGSVGLTVRLRNVSNKSVNASCRVRIVDAAGPEEPKPLPERKVEIAAGGEAVVGFSAPMGAIREVARLEAQASVDAERPSSGRALVVIPPPRRVVNDGTLPKQIYAHYMGCWPVASGALLSGRRGEHEHLNHTSDDPANQRGGHVRNYDLAPSDMELSAYESADLEIRRALRIGIDGFAIDAWAGDDGARKFLDVLFRVAEEKDYPFGLTVCIDPICGGNIVDTVKDLLDRHGDSPKLARRGGKPLIFGYMSWIPSHAGLYDYWGGECPYEIKRLRSMPLGWHLMGQTYRAAAQKVGQPIYYQYGMGFFFNDFDKSLATKDDLPRAAGVLGRYVDAIGSFQWSLDAEVGEAVKRSGAEWSNQVGMYQKENIPFESYIPKGTEWLEWKWGGLRKQDATILQLITWNDYGENSCVAPALDTRYTLYDLTGYQIAWWKRGSPPPVKHDRLYLTYAKYPRGAKVFPFKEGVRRERVLEVLTILPEPATVRLPGRDIEYEAPAGYHRQGFPLAPGPVVAEIVRNGKVSTRLESPEPISDRPFRESNGLVCFSTEFARHWKEDFGDTPPYRYNEYGDEDGDGLPNWFEMYWFGRLYDWSTVTDAEPGDDPDDDGKTNLEEYLARTDPTMIERAALDKKIEQKIQQSLTDTEKPKPSDEDILDDLE